MGEGIEGITTSAFFAKKLKVVPCTSSETITIKNATLKKSCALGNPAINGNTARITGTAPRKPTHEINERSRRLKPLNGKSPIKTDSGRANKIIHSDNSSAGTAMGKSALGVSNKP